MWFMAESVTKPQKLIKAYIQWRLAVEKFWQSTSERMRSLWEDNRLSKGTQQAKNVATICLETSLEKELCIMPNSEIEPWKLGKQLNFLRSTYVAIKFWKK